MRVNNKSGSVSLDWQLRQRQATAYLDQVSRQLGEQQRLASRCFVEGGTPAPSVVRFAKENDIDLIVLNRIGRTRLTDFGDGSVWRRVGSCACSVHCTNSRYKTVLDRVLETPCHDMRLPETAETHALLERLLEISRLQASRRFSELRSHVPADVEISTETRCADAVSDGIVRYANDEHADLVVLCAHGSGGGHPWRYGPLAEFLLGHSASPVLVFRQSNEASAQHYRSQYCRS